MMKIAKMDKNETIVSLCSAVLEGSIKTVTIRTNNM